MKLILHLVRKDLARLRWWLVAWAGVLLLPILVGADFITHDPFRTADWNLPNVLHGFEALEVFVGYLLVLVLIEEDAVVGTRQFWLTRPISGGRLFAAKALGAIVILAGMPILVSLPWWLWCGLDARAIAIAAAETCALAAIIATPAALVAVMTDSLARALLWTLVLVAVVLAGILFFGIVVTSLADRSWFRSLWLSRDVVIVGALVVELAVIVAAQFVWRRRAILLAAFVVLAGATLLLASRAPWQLFGGDNPREFQAARATNIGVQFARAWTEPRQDREGATNRLESISARFVADRPPAGTVLDGLGAEQSWRWADRPPIERIGLVGGAFNHQRAIGEAIGLREPPRDRETEEFWRAKQAANPLLAVPPPWREPPAVEPPTEYSFTAWSQMRPSVVARLRMEPTRYHARLWLAMLRPRIQFELPPQPTGWRGFPGASLRVDRVVRRPDEATVWLVMRVPMSFTQRLRAFAETRAWFYLFHAGASPIVINRTRGEFQIRRWAEFRELFVNGVALRWAPISISGGAVIRHGREVPRPGWLEGATFGVLRVETDAVFARESTVENISIEQARPGRTP